MFEFYNTWQAIPIFAFLFLLCITPVAIPIILAIILKDAYWLFFEILGIYFTTCSFDMFIRFVKDSRVK